MKWSDLLQWEGSSLSQQAQAYEKSAQSLRSASESLQSNVSSVTGQGSTVDAARRAMLKLCGEVDKQEAKLTALASVLSEASEGAETVGTAARKLDGTAANHSLHIGADGSVQYVGPHNVSPADAVTIKKNMKLVSQQVRAIMDKAASVVQNTRSRLSGMGSGSSYANGSSKGTRAPKKDLKLPPKGASEKEVAKWWSSLSSKEKAELIDKHPYEIGSLNGVDGTSRDKANRKVLKKEAEEILTERNRMMRENSQYPGRYGAAQFAQLEERQRALDNVQKTLDRSKEDGMPRQLLSLDAKHGRVTAVVAQGNVDTAKHIGVIVPGLYSNVAKNLDDYDDKASVMGANVRKHAHGEEVAMVSYLGYDAPQNKIEAAMIRKANAGAKQLAGFLNGMHASREYGAGDAHVTAVTHSYGSTTAGKALTMTDEGAVDDLIQFGSPGSGVQSVDEFHLEKGHAWVSAAPYREDIVQGLGDDGRYGKNPAKMPGYNHLSGDVGAGEGWFVPFSKHGGYFNEGSEALDDISKVVAGRGVPRSTR